MKVLFLDIDGVLNSYQNPGGLYAMSRSKLRLLSFVIKTTGAEIVLSSTWRKRPDSYQRAKTKLGYRGLRILDKTPDYLGIRTCRGDEIQFWLKEHPSVKTYAIVDDDGDMLLSQRPYFVQTNGDVGLTMDDALKLILILISPKEREVQ